MWDACDGMSETATSKYKKKKSLNFLFIEIEFMLRLQPTSGEAENNRLTKQKLNSGEIT